MNRTQIKSDFKEACRALVFYCLLLFVAIPVAVGVFVFSVLYSLAILGPWLSGKIAVKHRFRWGIDLVFGIDSIHEFREDIKGLVGKHAELDIGDRSGPEIRKDIYELHEEASEQAERGEFIITIVTGILSLVIGTITGTPVVGWLLGSYSVVMTLTISLHVVILDVLAYGKTDELSPYRRKHLVLLEGWNRAILTSRTTQAAVLLVGILHRISPLGYQIAKELLDEAMEQDMRWFETIIFLSVTLGKLANQLITNGTLSTATTDS